MKRLTEKGHIYTDDQVFRDICSLNISNCLNRLRQYEDTELMPDQIIEIDELYYEKCREVAEMNKAEEHDRWIPIEDSTPEEGGMYIVTALDGDIIHVTFAKWQNRYKRFDMTGSRSYWRVISWKHLPEPYKGAD